ncbi:MAG: amidohydrolase family protein [Bacteriovoracaceae bacterium]|nr:amidohydrolase family protein [Bacteriovoracaceae bacterium]
MSLLLKNASYIDPTNLKIFKGDLLLDCGKMEKLCSGHGKSGSSEYDLGGKWVTKSFVCGHHHAYSLLARGMPYPKKAPTNFEEILKSIWWNLDKKLDRDMVRASALGTALQLAKAGSTFVIDHHSSPNFSNGVLGTIKEAFESLGLSHHLCLELSDRDGQKCLEDGLLETSRFLESGHGLIGLHASFTVSDSLLASARTLVDRYDSGIHIHVAEDLCDQSDCQKKYGKSVVERLADYGFLRNKKTILAHCLHLSDNERKLLKDSACSIVVSTESNQNNGVGKFDISGLNPDRVMLGTDGMHSNMIQSARVFFLDQHSDGGADMGLCYQIFRNSHRYLKENQIAGDGGDNLVVFNYDSPTEINDQNFLGHFFYGLSERHVDSVISSGEFIVKEKKIVKQDEDEILKFCREQGERLWQKL